MLASGPGDPMVTDVAPPRAAQSERGLADAMLTGSGLPDFRLPAEREAHDPPEARGVARDGVRLLVSRRGSGQISQHVFRDLPGPTVAAMAARSANRAPERHSASRPTGAMARRCSREASSGTTPPYFECVSICDATTEDSTASPFSTTAAAVSSHEDSMPRMRTTPTVPPRGDRRICPK